MSDFELAQLLQGQSRAVVIAEKEVDLRAVGGTNHLFLLILAEGSHAAGGRGGGFGERRVVRVAHFKCDRGGCEKLFDTSDEQKVSMFEVPFHVARIPITLGDGTVTMGYGVVDPELVGELKAKAPPSA
ncbi:MAG: hypothetical protein JRN24_03105 [Nitrososphaerota archaeon]|nr:hypothetical protein [Nitrososphaerota archaeon]